MIVEIPTPSPECLPQGLDVAADGSVFYTETGAGKIARVIGTHRHGRKYALPAGASPNIVKVDGSFVWFTDGGNAAVGRLDPATGAVVEYPVPSGASPNFLQIAPDGSKWFSEPSGVGRLSPTGVITEWQVTLEKTDSHIEQLSLDPAGNVWFTELNYDGTGPAGTNLVRRLDPATNVVRAYPVPTFGGTPAGVVAAPSGKVWVSEYPLRRRLSRSSIPTRPPSRRGSCTPTVRPRRRASWGRGRTQATPRAPWRPRSRARTAT